MKKDHSQPLFAEERKEQILILLRENTKILVPELCKIFQVSPATIRNDLRDLEKEGKLRRTHGGAIPVGKSSFEMNSADKEITCLEQKQKIAKYAAQLVEDGDTIALDSGTTMLELAKCLSDKKNLTIVLNDIQIASYLEQNSSANIIVIGGTLRHGFRCTIGPMTIDALQNLNVDKAFIATNAFSVEKGFTTPDLNQAEVKKAFIQTASERIVLCDSSKIGKITFASFATIQDVDKLITDSQISPKMSRYLNDSQEEMETSIV
jgi:DeoR family fructose operon transcriptional repressor